jgi:hypothetical protein
MVGQFISMEVITAIGNLLRKNQLAFFMLLIEADSITREIEEIVPTNAKDRIFGIKFYVSKSPEVDYYLIKSTIECLGFQCWDSSCQEIN